MRILALILAALLLSACASPLKRYGPGSGYNYSPEVDACVSARRADCATAAPAAIIDGYVIEIGTPDPAAVDAWIVHHLREPHRDEREDRALRTLKLSLTADTATTALGLACGLAEGNPLFAGSRVVLLPIAQGVLYTYTRKAADRSPRAFSTAPDIEAAKWPSTIAALSNATTILRVCL
jgi:hypothetical protein